MAAGGTGGHIYPGIAISEKLKETFPGSEIIFVGSHVGMEKNIIPPLGYPLELLRSRGFEKKISLETLLAIKGIGDSVYDAYKLLKKEKPDLVIGMGGFTSAMLLLVASLMGIPTMIHEQNAYPGRSNRLTGKSVDRIGLGFNEASNYFSDKKTFVAGNPIREEFKNINREKSRKKLGIKPEEKLIIFMGGSQGAKSINEAALHVLKNNKKENLIFYLLTGKDSFNSIKDSIKDLEIPESNIHVLDYCNDMANLLAAGDLIVSRSGASTVAEISACELPSILIPYPQAAGDHQTFNAKVITDNQGGILIEDKNLTGPLLLKTINSILDDPDILNKMREKTGEKKILDADERFCNEAYKLVKETKKKSKKKVKEKA